MNDGTRAKTQTILNIRRKKIGMKNNNKKISIYAYRKLVYAVMSTTIPIISVSLHLLSNSSISFSLSIYIHETTKAISIFFLLNETRFDFSSIEWDRKQKKYLTWIRRKDIWCTYICLNNWEKSTMCNIFSTEIEMERASLDERDPWRE
jgi:hypothetical protein